MLTLSQAPAAFHVMAKPTGAICNLDCQYCFFLSKDQLYPGSGFRMSPQVLEAYLRQLLDGHADQAEVVVAFQGGEPTLMGLDFFRQVIELERKLARPGQTILNTMQTNGTLLDDAWGEFLAEHDFLVGLSIDGPRHMHDAYRVDKGGKPTFDRVMKGLDVLRRHGVQWNALTTVHAANAGHGREVYVFLRDVCGAGFTQFIPIVERLAEASPGSAALGTAADGRGHEAVTDRSITGEQYGQFMVDIFEEWVRRDVGSVYVQLFDTALAHWAGMDQAGVCVHARTCGTQVALEHNGDVYSCDHFVDPQHLLGNITGGRTLLQLLASPQQRRFGQDKLDTLPAYCRDCDVRFACNGGCPKDRIAFTPAGEPGLHYLCEGYRRFFRHVDLPMKAMAAQLRAGRPPAEVMRAVARKDAKREPQSPCPCGAGRQWQHCHGHSAGSSGFSG